MAQIVNNHLLHLRFKVCSFNLHLVFKCFLESPFAQISDYINLGKVS